MISDRQTSLRGVVGDQSLKLGTVGGAKVKVDVITSHAQNMAHQFNVGNLCQVANTRA